jgi:3-hydroxyisobutyrate dehydrogenase-like beta-hydroxyacid dehydrogenase
VDDLVRRGAVEVKKLEEIAKADLILLCVTTAKVVEDTVHALRPHLRNGHIILDSGTSPPALTERLARDLKPLGISYCDIPLTGGPEQARQGALGILCGADEEVFLRIHPILACFASTIRRFGPPGSGHTAKLISNFLVTGMFALVAEAFTAARAAQIDWKDLYEVMLNGSGNSGVLRKMVEPALKGDFDGYRFAIANAAKDIGYYRDIAEKLGCESRLTDSIAEIFTKALETGHGGRNVSHLLDPAIDDVT